MSHLEQRRAAIAQAWNLTDELVLVGAGEPPLMPGTDQPYGFMAHPEFRYLAGSDGPDEVLAFDPDEGWTLFVPVPTEQDQVWHGGHAPSGLPLQELDAWIAARPGRSFAQLGCKVDGVEAEDALGERVRAAVTAARRVKDADEQTHLQAAAQATRRGFLAAMKEARAGLTERQVEVELESAFARAGSARPAFDSIVATGSNAAVLHLAPTGRTLEAGDLLLIDAGAEAHGYASDCTRTWVVGGRPNPEQTDLHQLVLEVQQAAIAKCVPGKEYREIHMEAAEQMTRGLIDFGLLRGKPDSLVERDAHALFWPHGIGHLIGLAVHDAGGYLDGRRPSPRPGLKWLRADLPLEAGHALTIEPGLYFIPTLLENEKTRDAYRDAVDWIRVDSLLDFGGIRIEDTLLVTESDPEVLTRGIPHGIVV